MTKKDALEKLEHARQIFIGRLRSSIADYAQYGMTLRKTEAAIANENWKQAVTEIWKCLSRQPGCDLEIVNPDGDMAMILYRLDVDLQNLIRNDSVIARVNAVGVTV